MLRLALEDEGYVVSEAADGAAGLAAVAAQPDVVLFDLMLPDIDGFSVCRSIRRVSDAGDHDHGSGRQPRLVVVRGWADDYVTKPLVAKELAARIRALLRRVHPVTAESVGPRRTLIGDLVIGVEEGNVTRDGVPLPLTRTEFRLLVELASAQGRVCSREHLLDRVWGYGYFGDSRIVDVHIGRLRSKIERDPANPRHIITARGLGYRLAS